MYTGMAWKQQGCPRELRTRASLHIPHSTPHGRVALNGDGLHEAETGLEARFRVVAGDRYGNPTPAAALDVCAVREQGSPFSSVPLINVL